MSMPSYECRQSLRWSGRLAGLFVGLALLASTTRGAMQEQPPYTVPGAAWERIDPPGDVGFSSEKLAQAEAFAESLPSRAVVIVVGGRILAQWGRPEAKFPVHSMRKSILSILLGRQVELGRIELSSTLAELGVDDESPTLSAAEKEATVADLLTARSGVYHPANYETRSRAEQRPERGSHAPGTFWYYNNWDFNALGTVYERAAGRSVFEAFNEELAVPLRLEDFEAKDGRPMRSSVSRHAAYTFNMSARDLGRIGLLVLREGRWGEQQIVPGGWLAQSTRSHAEAEFGLGWGYMWWVAPEGRAYPGFDAGGPTILARGTGGHVMAIVPHRDMVVVHRVNSSMPNPANYVGARDLGRLLQMIVDAAPDVNVAP